MIENLPMSGMIGYGKRKDGFLESSSADDKRAMLQISRSEATPLVDHVHGRGPGPSAASGTEKNAWSGTVAVTFTQKSPANRP
jgi:hypothetical protein